MRQITLQDMRDPAAAPETVWTMNAKPENSDWMYQFSLFTLQLNYLPDSLRDKLPPTDSRFRPDQRALENGDTDLAVREKHRLEEAQRARRRENEKNKIPHVPVYFEKRPTEADGEIIFQSNGKYWEDRMNRNWVNLIRIFD